MDTGTGVSCHGLDLRRTGTIGPYKLEQTQRFYSIFALVSPYVLISVGDQNEKSHCVVLCSKTVLSPLQ
jgi:hypothetical protein